MMCSKGLRKSFWNLKLASSPFSKNFIDSCLRESTAKIATSSLELQPTCTEIEDIWAKSNYFFLFYLSNKTLFRCVDNQKTEAASMNVHLQGEIKTFLNPLPMRQITILRFFIPNTNLSLHLLTKRQRLSEPDSLQHQSTRTHIWQFIFVLHCTLYIQVHDIGHWLLDCWWQNLASEK